MGEVVGQEPLHFQLENKPVRTKRIERLYEYVGASRVGMCLERGSIITDVYRKHRDLPPILLRATALSEILDKMSIYLLPGSLLAGNQASKPNYAPLFPEFAVDFIEEEDNVSSFFDFVYQVLNVFFKATALNTTARIFPSCGRSFSSGGETHTRTGSMPTFPAMLSPRRTI